MQMQLKMVMKKQLLLVMQKVKIGDADAVLRGSDQNFGILFIIGPILLKFSHNM